MQETDELNARNEQEIDGEAHPKNHAQRIFKNAYERLIKIRGQPSEIALGFAWGIFVGMSPFMGLHTVLALFFASLLKWNKIAAAIGVWISNPVTAPFLYGLTYYVGSGLMGNSRPLPLAGGINFSAFMDTLAQAPDIFWAMTIGGAVLGLPFSVAAYCFALSAVRKYQEDIREKLIRKKALLVKNRVRRLKARQRPKAAKKS